MPLSDFFAITAVLAFFTYRLWSATVGLAEDAKKTSARQATETRESLGIAKASLEVAQRAFVSIAGFKQIRLTDEGRKALGWDVLVTWQNTGQTPAKNAVNWINTIVFGPTLPKDFDCPRPDHDPVPIYIGPHDTIDSGTQRILMETAEKIYLGLAHVVIYGRFEYNDLFPQY